MSASGVTAAIDDSDLDSLCADLEPLLAEWAEEHGVPGLVAGIHLGGRERYLCTGITSVENPLPVTSETLFQIGSVTKTVTASTMMMLCESGRLTLDDRVLDLVPELRLADADVAANLTVRHLLNHTAGWRGDFFHDGGDGDDALQRYVAAMATLQQVRPLGSVASYNNAAFNLAGHVIARVSERPYEEAVADLVLRPAQMDSSFFGAKDVITRRFTVGHAARDGVPAVQRAWSQPRASAPCGGLVSTAEDQLRYARLHLRTAIRDEPVQGLGLMQVPTTPFGDRQIGLGWMLDDINGVRLASHGGTTIGQVALLMLGPQHDFAAVFLTNADTGERVINAARDVVLARLFGFEPPADDAIALPEAQRAQMTGTYDGGLYVMQLSSLEDRLRVSDFRLTPEGIRETQVAQLEIPSLEGAEIDALAGDRFRFRTGPYEGVVGAFVRGEDGDVMGIDLGRILPRVGE